MSRSTGFPIAVRATAAERSGGVCEVQIVCAGDPGQHHHHRRARGMGSTRRPETNHAANDLHSCAACHHYIETHPAEALRMGWRVPQHATPCDVPVFRRWVWVRLCDDGSVVPVQQEDA